MPQMKPMNWIMLFLFMNLIIMFMNIKNYYLKVILILNNNNEKKKKIMNKNWKW